MKRTTIKLNNKHNVICTVIGLGAALLLTGCAGMTAGQTSRLAAQPAQAGADQSAVYGPIRMASDIGQARSTCPIPAGWVAYHVALNETIYSIAARAAVGVDDLLKANCFPAGYGLKAGAWLAVPSQAAVTSPQTYLPLGVASFGADVRDVPAGGTVTLAWQAQGPVVSVRLGWLYGDQFIDEAHSLPAAGVWLVRVPDDGRESITYVLRAGDGVEEVAAQTTVSIGCGEGWFFSPAPPGCPLPPLATTFEEQAFERGTIVYIPALRALYLFVQGYPAHQIADTFVPGMPLVDPALNAVIPAGLMQPHGAINLAWRSDKRWQAALGYAVGAVRTYTGMHQRTLSANVVNGATSATSTTSENGANDATSATSSEVEVIYLSTSSGAVYRFAEGQGWLVITPR
jgi:hypothetical protein